jgi:hypothetical protein
MVLLPIRFLTVDQFFSGLQKLISRDFIPAMSATGIEARPGMLCQLELPLLKLKSTSSISIKLATG